MIYILATGDLMPANVLGFQNTRSHSAITEEITEDLTIIPEAHFFLDSRSYNSKETRVNGYHISKASREGKDILLITPSETMIDKRIRNQAVILNIKRVPEGH